MKKEGYGLEEKNTICITGVAATVLSLLQVPADEHMVPPLADVVEVAESAFDGKPCDRVFMYNPDAIAMWVYGKYQRYMDFAEECADLKLPMLSVYPPVTPVCFASMYTGLMPCDHGIQEYVKPVLKCRTIFDCLIDAGKKVAIVSTEGDSISMIFLERNMDYFIYPTVEECNEKAKQLIREDQYDCIVLYNADYDYYMHRVSPSGPRAVQALKENAETFCEIYDLIVECWQDHNTALAFAPDHGCHPSFPMPGKHGDDEPCDMNINHLWSFIPEGD